MQRGRGVSCGESGMEDLVEDWVDVRGRTVEEGLEGLSLVVPQPWCWSGGEICSACMIIDKRPMPSGSPENDEPDIFKRCCWAVNSAA